MNPASTNAMAAAMNILFRSIEEENNLVAVSAVESDAIPSNEQMRQLDVREHAMSRTMMMISSAIRHHIITGRRRRNALTLIHQLPVELLAKILLLASETSHYERLHALGCVASHWRNVIETTPAFWTVCSAYDPHILTIKAIAKSGALPLSIVACPLGPAYGDLPSLAAFMGVVGPQVHRWSSAAIAMETEDDRSRVLEAIRSPAPLLKSLMLANSLPQSEAYIVDLLASDASQMQYLTLQGVGVRDWGSPVFRGLRSLRLDGTRVSSPPIPHIIEMIRNSPQLEDLRLRRTPDFSATFISEGVIQRPGVGVKESTLLSSLQSIDLQQYPEDAVTAILSAIDAPVCGKLRVHIPEGSSTDSEPAPFHIGLGPALQSFVPALTSSLRETGEIKVQMGSTHLHYHNRPSLNTPGTFDIFIGTPHPLAPARWFHDILREIAPISITLCQEFDFADEEYVRVLWGFDTVTDLKLEEEVHGVEILFTHLSKPSEFHGAPRWPFPHLRRLSVEPDAFEHTAVLRMVAKRYEQNQATGGSGLASPPLPLEKLSFWRLDDAVYKAVQLIVGPECVDRSGTHDEDDDMGEAEDPEVENAGSEDEEEGSDAMEEDP